MDDKKERAKERREWILLISICLLTVFVLKTKVIITANVPTGSMLDTIQLEDKVLGNRLAYIKDDPQRGDIVIFYAPDETDGTKYIKRLIGLPGEKVVIKDAHIYIDDNETPLKETYLPEEWEYENDEMEFEVPEGAYLFFGDNRNESLDAREWENTYVYKEDIIAKAECVYFPFNDMKSLSRYKYEQ